MSRCPQVFYKYRDIDGAGLGFVERTILHNEIYLSSPAAFNDPFDCMPDFDLSSTPEQRQATFERALARMRPDQSPVRRRRVASRLALNPVVDPESDEARATMRALHHEHVRARIGVYCVGERPDSILMWSHYARSHTGVCLVFNGYCRPFPAAQKVRYASIRSPVKNASESSDESMEKALLTKHLGWKYEREWRVIQHGPGVYEIPEDALTGVILGARISTANEAQLLGWLSSRSHKCDVFRAVPSPAEFKLLIEPVASEP